MHVQKNIQKISGSLVFVNLFKCTRNMRSYVHILIDAVMSMAVTLTEKK